MIGKTISHYRIISLLGEGGMGEVYLAEDMKLSRKVALKFLPAGIDRDESAEKRLIREARAAASLNHPNICTIHEIDQADGRYFIVMEHVDGRSLGEMIEEGPLSIDEAVDIAMQVARGLQAAEKSGIVHRDIKPSNIMVTGGGQAKIMDFGLAKVDGSSRLTREGVAPGTVAYMSPEQARGEETDSRTDIWSLGVVLYEMISGRKPFKADYDAAITYSILSEAAAPLSSLRTGVPLDLERLVDRAMSKDRDERYQHADGLLADLKRIRRETGSSSEKAGTGAAPGKPAKRRKTSMITAIIVICSVAAGYLLLRPVFFDGPLVSAPVPVAVISFENQTGDPQYDYLRTVIPNLLITSLERSRYIHVATWERLQDLRKRTDSGESDIIGKELGFELCRLDGIRTIAFGSFTKAGDVFVTDIKVLDVETKELLKSASSRGRGVGSILESQIDELTREISRGIGLNERKTREVGAQIADVTTTSMEAYDYYLRGREEVYYWHIDEALESLGKAVAIDSTFAVAYLQLAEIYWNMGNMAWSLDALSRAKAFSGSSTEKERLYIEAFHELLVERDLDREQEILSRIIEKYPKEKQAHILMAQSHYMKGQVDEEIAEYEKVLELDPREARAYNTLAYIFVVQRDDFDRAMRYLDVYDTLLPGLANPVDSRAELLIRAGRFEEAKALLEKVLEIKHDFPYVGVKLGYCYAMEEDYTEALKWIDYHITVSAPKAWKAGGYVMRSYVYQVTGREDLAREDLQTALDIYALVDNVLGRVGAQWLAGWSHLESGGFGEARRFFTATLDDPRERFLYSMPQRPPVIDYDFSLSFSLGMLAVREGDLPGARTLLSDIDSFMPRIHFQYVDLATIYRNMLEAEISISKSDHKRAIELLEVSPRWTIPRFHPSFFVPFIVPYQKDLLARAYIHVGEPEKAIAEYEWLISAGPERELCPLIHPLYHYRLALLYEEAERHSEAALQYEKFLATWKGADDRHPEGLDAGSRLERLRAGKQDL